MWFREWLERRRLRRTIKPVLDSESDLAQAKAAALLAAIDARRPVCRHCFNPYVLKERDFAEQFRVRSILMLPSSGPDPMLCDNCYETAVASFNLRATMPGTSNSSQGNLLIQRFGAGS